MYVSYLCGHLTSEICIGTARPAQRQTSYHDSDLKKAEHHSYMVDIDSVHEDEPGMYTGTALRKNVLKLTHSSRVRSTTES